MADDAGSQGRRVDKCTYVLYRHRVLGRLWRRVCGKPAICVVKVWGRAPLYGRDPDWQAPRCNSHRQLDTEYLLGERVVEFFFQDRVP